MCGRDFLFQSGGKCGDLTAGPGNRGLCEKNVAGEARRTLILKPDEDDRPMSDQFSAGQGLQNSFMVFEKRE